MLFVEGCPYLWREGFHAFAKDVLALHPFLDEKKGPEVVREVLDDLLCADSLGQEIVDLVHCGALPAREDVSHDLAYTLHAHDSKLLADLVQCYLSVGERYDLVEEGVGIPH